MLWGARRQPALPTYWLPISQGLYITSASVGIPSRASALEGAGIIHNGSLGGFRIP